MKRSTILFAIAIAMLVASCGSSSTENTTVNVVDSVKVDSAAVKTVDTVLTNVDSAKCAE